MSKPRSVSARPLILISQSEAARLTALAQEMERASPVAANLLMDELERAKIRPDDKMPEDVVRMHSEVEFVDEAHGDARTVTLVYPAEADIAAGKISVLTPVGAGLLGLRPDQQIEWPDRDGVKRMLRVLQVRTRPS